MEPIAIVGLSFRLPRGIEDTSSLWDTLVNGKNVMTPWPEDRTSIKGFYEADTSKINRLHSMGGHFIDGKLGEFDAPFFSINFKEAAAMDPQQHLLLETSYRALENAGISLDKVAGTATGVFVGSMADDYARIGSKDPDEAAIHAATGQCMGLLANRLSWVFDMKGPSVQINTACSSSMIATDLACQSLRVGQSSLALVAGSSIMLGPETSIDLTNMKVLSPDSLSFSFDHRANGYGRGEGAIVFVLKRLSDAVTDGDMIRAVIRATGSNQDGHTPGITQPSISSQEDLIRTVYKSCGLGFESTLYAEAHGSSSLVSHHFFMELRMLFIFIGTGTQLGDSSEAKALGRVFKSSRPSNKPLYIGSVKANIGHLEGGSGLAGMLKSVLILEKGIIPPNALFEKLNPKINARALNIQVPTSCIPWPSEGLRRISVNSFGFGGSNGHAILDDAYHCLRELGLKGNHQTQVRQVWPARIEPRFDENFHTFPNNGIIDQEGDKNILPQNASGTNSTPKVLVWSAKNEEALKRTTKNYAAYMESSTPNLDQIAYTLAVKRNRLTWRSFAVLKADTPGLPPKLPSIRSSRDVGLAFIFTGQGAQYAGMGLELLTYPAFRSTLETANAVFQALGATWSLHDVILDEHRINGPQLSQPLCTALQLGLVELLRSFGIVPTAVIGHSSGEIAAAYTVGALSLESACKVAYHRGRLAAQLAVTTSQPGAMMSVNLPEQQVHSYLSEISLEGRIHIACVNSPLNVTLSGDEASIDTLKCHLEQDTIFARKLATGVAYHTPTMRDVATEYYSCLENLEERDIGAHNILMVSSVTGGKVSRGQLSGSQYWVDNLVSPVRFSDALQYLEVAAPRADGLKPLAIYLEVGPSGALRRPVCDTVGEKVQYISTLSRFDSPLTTILSLAGKLFACGYPVSIAAANQQNEDPSQPFLVDLPEYPFDHSQSYWYETRLSRDWRLRDAAPSTLLGVRVADWNPLEPRWRSMLSVKDIPWIADHVVGDVPYLPGTGIIMLALEAVKQTVQTHQPISGFVIKEITFMSPIVVRPEGRTEVITQLCSQQRGHEKSSLRFEVRVFACVDEYWNECSRAIIIVEDAQDTINEVDGEREAHAAAQASARAYEESKQICVKPLSKSDFYKWHTAQGLKYGPSFSLVEETSWDGMGLGIAIGQIDSASAESFDGIVHPGVLDCAFQVASTANSSGMTKPLSAMILHKLEDVWISPTGWQHPDTRRIHVLSRSKRKTSVPGLDCSFSLLSDNGTALFCVEKLEMLPAGVRDRTGGNRNRKGILHSIAWKPQLSELSRSQLRECCFDFNIFLQLASHETPDQRLLEIGAGSSDMTKGILAILRQIEESTGGIAFWEYLYTEASEALLESIREAYTTHDQEDRLHFATFDVEKDITTEKLGQHTYSIIVFSPEDALRRMKTKDLVSVMRNVRQALRPGGYLVGHGLLAIDDSINSNCDEEKLSNGSSRMTKLEWEDLLGTAGFSGIDLVIPGPAKNQVTISRAVEEPTSMQESDSLLVVDDRHEHQRSIASHLLTTTLFKNAEILSLSQLVAKSPDDAPRKSLIFLADIDGSVLAQMPEPFFKPIQRLIQNTANILWAARVDHSGQSQSLMPVAGVKDGFLRTIRSEYPGKRIVSLTLEDEHQTSSVQDITVCITQVFTSSFIAAKPETEYVVMDGLLHTARLIRELALGEKLAATLDNGSNIERPKLARAEPWLPGPALKVDIQSPGSLETLRLVQDDSVGADLAPEEVEIQAKTWGLSFRDVFIALGRLEEDDFGLDCAGVVTRVGEQCSGLKVGDRVCMAAIGCMRMFPRANQASVAKIPDDVEFAEACAAVGPVVTAWRSLVDVARIQRGDRILIHAASGATGQLAVQIARHFGAEIFATVGYSSKKQLLMETYGIPEDHIFYSRNTSFAKSIKRITDGYGVDIVLNSIGGKSLHASWDCVAPYGRFIEIGKTDIHANSQLPMAQFAANVAFAAVDIRDILLHRHDIVAGLMQKTMELMTNGSLCAPRPVHLYKISALEEALRYLQSGNNTGRVVIDLDPCSVVQKHISVRREPWTLDSNASYIVVGGFGGIGRSILKWMANKGAKHLIVPSRSGFAHKPEAVKVVEDLSRRGVTVYGPKCDTSVAADLSRLLEDCTKSLPYIRGCINAAMALNDTMFDNMTYSQWKRTVRSKVQTSWNLHTLLPNDLNFFILLSSISGIVGNSGQSNYAAGCSFQDALAQYRTRNGQKALSIDLGVVADVGVVADGTQKKLGSGVRESRPIYEPEILAFLELCCDSESQPARSSHIVMGLSTPADLLIQGIEPPEFMQRPLFAAQAPRRGQGNGAAGGHVNYGALFREAESAEDRASIVFKSLAKKLARAISVKPEEIDASQPLHVFGVDSLVATEIKNWVAKEFAAEVAVFELMGGRSVAAICELVTRMSQFQVHGL
ncbi:putative polyketide synthase [Nemania sp. FL0031]|nr:putative polyketide synthase [Nemania sp. FL0031]